MIVTLKFAPYNTRRYSRPWAANITFPDGIKPAYEFNGHCDSDGLTVLIEAETGGIIAYGQKDHRGSGTRKSFAIVQVDGSTADVSEAEARKHVATPKQAVIDLVEIN